MQAIDKANGYIFGGLTQSNESIMMAAVGGNPTYRDVMDVQERWLDHKDLWDEWELQQQEKRMNEKQ